MYKHTLKRLQEVFASARTRTQTRTPITEFMICECFVCVQNFPFRVHRMRGDMPDILYTDNSVRRRVLIGVHPVPRTRVLLPRKRDSAKCNDVVHTRWPGTDCTIRRLVNVVLVATQIMFSFCVRVRTQTYYCYRMGQSSPSSTMSLLSGFVYRMGGKKRLHLFFTGHTHTLRRQEYLHVRRKSMKITQYSHCAPQTYTDTAIFFLLNNGILRNYICTLFTSASHRTHGHCGHCPWFALFCIRHTVTFGPSLPASMTVTCR